MLKLLAASGVREENISLIALDILKEEPQGRARALRVDYTPTFIFFSDGKEQTRIVERPIKSLERSVCSFRTR